MAAIAKHLPDGRVAVIQDDGTTHFIHPDGTVEGENNQVQAQPQTLAGKASAAVQNIGQATGKALASPISNPGTQKTLSAPTPQAMTQAYVAADKRYPTENILPAAGSTAGSVLGAESGIPFAATMLSGAGGAIGDFARQGVAKLRGNPGVPQDVGESAKSALVSGGVNAGAELGGSALLKGIESFGAKAFARSGMDKFKQFILDATKPSMSSAESQAVKAKYFDAPAANPGQVNNFIDDVLGERGMSVGQDVKEPNISPATLNAWKKAGMTDEEIARTAEHQKGLEAQLGDLSRTVKPKVTSDLGLPVVADYKPAADIKIALNNPENLTYGRLSQLQQYVGDHANFGDQERTAAEKVYGKLYGQLGDLLDQTAEKNGFSDAHQMVKENGRKYYQNRMIQNALENSREFPPSGPQVNFGKLSSHLNSVGDDEVKSLFGDNSKYFNTLRDLSNNAAAVSKDEVTARIGMTGRGRAYVRPGTLMDRAKYYPNTQNILARNLGDQASQADVLPAVPFPLFEQPLKTTGKAYLDKKTR